MRSGLCSCDALRRRSGAGAEALPEVAGGGAGKLMSLYYNSSVRPGFLHEEDEFVRSVDKVRPECFNLWESILRGFQCNGALHRDAPEGFCRVGLA